MGLITGLAGLGLRRRGGWDPSTRGPTHTTTTTHNTRTYRTDPFLKKEWYDIKAPGYFKTRKVGKTLITRTTGTSE